LCRITDKAREKQWDEQCRIGETGDKRKDGCIGRFENDTNNKPQEEDTYLETDTDNVKGPLILFGEFEAALS